MLAEPGAVERVAQIEDELRLAARLTALREQMVTELRRNGESVVDTSGTGPT
ncbi:MAG: hypothetical protein ACT4PW_04485 [Acidimicrobiia bacterium]